MSSSNQASAPPAYYPAKKTKGALAQPEIPTASRPTRPTTKPAAPARKGQTTAWTVLSNAAQTRSKVPPPGAIPLGSTTRSAAAAKAKDRPPTSGKLDLSTVQTGQLLWYRYTTGQTALWIPAKVSKVGDLRNQGDISVTVLLPQSKMVTVSQSKIDDEDRPILELIASYFAERLEVLEKRRSATGPLAELAQMGLDKMNGDWKSPAGNGSSSSFSSLTSLTYKLGANVSAIAKSSAKAKLTSKVTTDSDLSDLDDDDFRGTAKPKTRKRASSPSTSASASSSSAPPKKPRIEPEKPTTGITTVTFTRRAAPRPAATATSDSTLDPRPTTTATANFSQESILDSIASNTFVGPVYSGSESDSDMDIPGVGPSAPRPSHLELSVPIGIGILALRSDPVLGSRFAPARVIGYAPTDLLVVRFYDGQENDHLPRSEMVIMGDAEFGSANVEAIPDLPPVPRGYRNPVLEARIKAVLPALDDLACGKRTSARVTLYEKATSVRAADRRAAETELAGRLGGEPFSKPEMKLIRRALEARYVLGVAGLAEEPEPVVASQDDEVEMPSGSQGRRGAAAKGKGKAKAGSAAAAKAAKAAALLQVSPDRQRRSRKEVATYAESSSDSDLEFVKEQDGDGNIVTANTGTLDQPDQVHLTPPHVLSESELAGAPSLETTFPPPPSTLSRADQRFMDLVLFPECIARLLVLTHLANAHTGEIADTHIRTAGGVGDDMDVDDELTAAVTLPSSSSSSLSSSQPQAPATTTGSNPSIPDWHLRAIKQFKMNSDQFNDPRTWRDVPAVTVQYGLSVEEEAQVLPKAEELLRDCHWMHALLLLKRSNSGKGHGRSRR